MKKRILSFLLMLSLLCSSLSVLGASVAYASPDTEESTAVIKSGNYKDLYVKDGLVALFVAYDAISSEEDASVWTPVNLYGAPGYSSYLDPATYTASLSRGTYLGFKWENGYLSHYVHTQATGNRGSDESSLLNLDALGTGTSYTVQEVYQLTGTVGGTVETVPAVNGSTLTNYSALAQKAFMVFNGGSLIGDMQIHMQYYAAIKTNKWIIGGYLTTFTNVSGNNFFIGNYYGSTQRQGLVGDDGTDLSAYYVSNGTIGVIESSLVRDGASYTVRYRHSLYNHPYGTQTSFSSTVTGTSTQMRVLIGMPSRAFSVRVYNRALNEREMNQNHLADLCGFYDIDVSKLLLLSDGELDTILEATKGFDFSMDTDKGTAYLAEKANLERIINPPSLDDEKRQKSEYDEMYVGADGALSENGASLIALFSYYGSSDTSLDIASGVWHNKVSVTDAHLVGETYSASSTDGWRTRLNGGFGYDLLISESSSSYWMDVQESESALSLDPLLLASADFTVEYSAAFPNYLLSDGSNYTGLRRSRDVVNDIPSDRIGYFGNYATRAGSVDSNGGAIAPDGSHVREMRWFVGTKDETWLGVYKRLGNVFSSGRTLWGDYSRESTAPYSQTVTRNETDDTAVYSVYANGVKVVSNEFSSALSVNSFSYYPKGEPYSFVLFRAVPVTVYAVRVYNGILSEAEMIQNAFIDLMAYYGAEYTSYISLGKESKRIVEKAMLEVGYGVEKDDYETALFTLIAQLSSPFDMSETLYVTDGLTVLLSAYNGVSTDLIESGESAVLWQNAVTVGSFATLKGTGWKRNASGGVTIVKTIEDYTLSPSGTMFLSNEDYALVLNAEMLPAESYTVEYVANPVGITNEDGTRFIDSLSKYGIYSENGTAIGPLRAMQFACYSAGSGKGAQMERRWNYGVGDTPFASAGGRPTLAAYAYDYSWYGLARDRILTTTITLDTTAGGHSYRFYSDLEALGSAGIESANVISVKEADYMFRLMGGMAGTIYSVRVYNRVLTAAEMAQNHFADLIYFYGIDISTLRDALVATGDISAITSAFVDIGFDMTKDEAEERFNACLTDVWLSYSGFGMRKDDVGGLRYYFDLGFGGINAMLKADAEIEIGAIVNVGKSSIPVLDGYGYDYKLLAFDSVAGKYKGHFVDEDTFAVTVRYRDASRISMLTDVIVRGYVIVTLADGTSITYYKDLTPDAPGELFEGYHSMVSSEKSPIYLFPELAERFDKRVNDAYTDLYIHLDASATKEGSGSEQAPFRDFEKAFLHLKSSLHEMDEPTHVYFVVKDGLYRVSDMQSLTDADMQYPYCDLSMLADGENVCLTTTTGLGKEFTSLGGNLYTYQFEKDKDGNYPEFRYLYVDGKIATMAHNGGTRSALGGMYQTVFDRSFEAVYQTAADLATQGKLALDTVPSQYADREDLMELFRSYIPRLLSPESSEGVGKVTGQSLNKYYLDEMLVGDLSEAMEIGRRDMLAYADALEQELLNKEASETLTPNEMAEIANQRKYISEIRDENLWRRHALARNVVEMHVTAEYLFDIMHVTGVDYDDYYVHTVNGETRRYVACYFDASIYQNMQIPGSHSLEEGFYVFLQGARAYVDSENEYFYDAERGVLYYYSETGVERKCFERPTSDYLLKLENVENIRIEGISFTGVDDLYLSKTGHSGTLGGGDVFAEGAIDGYHPFPTRSAIYLNNVSHLNVLNCSFYELGCEGITARGWLEDVTVDSCVFDTIGSAAIRFGDDIRERVRETWVENVIGHRDISFTNNYLNNISTEYRAPALQLTTCQSGVIQHNTIKNTTYSAMAVGWNWAYSSSRVEFILNLENVDISYNYVSSFMTEMADGGAIYVTGPNAPVSETEYINFMHHNYVLYTNNTGDGRGGFVAGLYFDGASSSWYCYENVVTEHAYGASDEENRYTQYGISEETAQALRSRRALAIYIYVQWIDGQETHNMLLEKNYILNVRATDKKEQQFETYKNYITVKDAVAGRKIMEKDTVCIVGIQEIPREAGRIITEAGAEDYFGDVEDILDNVY